MSRPATSQRAPWWAFALLVAAGSAGCSDGNGLPANAGSSSDGGVGGHGGSVGGIQTGPCQNWETKACGIELGTRAGVVQCAKGNQTCQNGTWGPCLPDAALGIQTVPAPATSKVGTARLGINAIGGSATQCASNPCDPTCQVFTDVPDSAVTSPIVEAGTPYLGGTLAGSNVPQGFQDKGSDPNAVCYPGCTSAACAQACQYDQHCSDTVNKTCVAYAPGESGACTGIDITAGVGCETSDGKYRVITVCNRGTADAAPGIDCWLFPGNSQQMPSATPDISTATKIATTTQTLKPGDCQSMMVADTHPPFDSSGAQEMACNVSGTAWVTFSAGPNPPSANEDPSNELPWSQKDGAYAAGAPYAVASLVDPAGTNVGPAPPTKSTAITGTDAWTNANRAYGPDLAYATAAPGLPSSVTSSLTSNPSTDTKSLGSAAYSTDSTYGTVAVASRGGTQTIDFSGFSFGANLPPTATVTSVNVQVIWKTDATDHVMSTSVQPFVGTTSLATANTVSFTTGSNSPATNYTQTLSGLTGITGANLRDSGFKVRVIFTDNDNGNSTMNASVDSVVVTVAYSDASQSAGISLSGFGLGIPATAQVTNLVIATTWKSSLATTDAQLLFHATSNGSVIAGSEYSEISPSTSAVTRTVTIANPGLTGAGLSDTAFAVQVYASRLGPLSFTAFLDSVQVTATWTGAVGGETRGVYYENFGFSGIPAGATITGVTAHASWRQATNYSMTFGVQSYLSTTALGTETTDTTQPTTFTTVSQSVTGATAGTITPADLNSGNFKVHVRVTR